MRSGMVTITDGGPRTTGAAPPWQYGDNALSLRAEIRVERGARPGAYRRSTKRLAKGTSAPIAWKPDVFAGAGSNSGLLGVLPFIPEQQPGLFLEVTTRTEPGALDAQVGQLRHAGQSLRLRAAIAEGGCQTPMGVHEWNVAPHGRP